jgi:hypothetical protein
MWEPGLALLLLLTTAIGIGLVARAALAVPGAAPLPISLLALAGACAAAALLPALFLLGLPRAAVLGATYALAAVGWWRWARGGLLRPDRRALAATALLLLPLLGPLVAAVALPTLAEDAALVWWPKVAEVAAGRWPELHVATTVHTNPGYPRGMAWLTNLACPWGPTPAVMHVVAWAPAWLVAVAMLAFVRHRGAYGMGLLLALTFVVLPDAAFYASLGMADGAMAGAILLAAIGLSWRNERYCGLGLAVLAGIGACSLKEEGKLVLAVVAVTTLLDSCRGRLPWRRLLLLGSAPVVLIPFWLASRGERATRLEALPTLLQEPDILLARTAAALRQMGEALVAGPSYDGPSYAGMLVLVSLALLVPRPWPRPLAPWPALVFLPVVVLVYVGTGVDMRWHVGSTFDRLMLQLVPTLWLAAGLRLVAVAK